MTNTLLRRCLALFVALACLAGASVAQTNRQSPLGVNVREMRYWGTEMHTVDFFKRAANGSNGIWLTQCAWPCSNGWNTNEQGLMDLDAAGWPKSLPAADATAKYRYVTTILWMNADKLPVGRWTVLYDGEGTLAYGQNGVTRNAAASTPGRDAFDVAAVDNRWLTLSITATDPQRTGNYLRNIRVIPPGGTCNDDPFAYAADAAVCPSSYRALSETYATQPFHPQFLSDLRPFAALRFMQFFSTNLDQNTQWSERSHSTDISWGANAAKGAPFEAALDLANTLDASPWLNVPAMASDDYVVQFARLAKERLTTARPIYLEYGNEVWNGVYPYSIGSQYAKDRGRARWPTSTESDYAKGMNWFALRTKQICALWKQEFGPRAAQVKCVMGAQGGGPWVADHYLLSCPLHAAEPGGSTCDAAAGIDAVAAGYYFGGHVADPAFQTQIEAEWFTQTDGGLTKLFQELADGSVLTAPPGWNLARATQALIASQMAANRPVATAHGVEMVVYEGGNELFGRDSSAYQVKLQTLFEQAQRDPRMGTAYTAVLNQWRANDGHLYMVFESTGRYSSSRGNSTLLEWQGQPRSQAPKYDAVLNFVANNPCWWIGCAAANIDFAPGWNLAGNGTNGSIDVAAAFGNPNQVGTVWKWSAAASKWAFYSPELARVDLLDYAAGKGYEVLTTIGRGEGFWVNAKSAFSLTLPAAAGLLASTAYRDPTTGSGRLQRGWNLIASGDGKSPRQFNDALSTQSPPPGTIAPNLASLWAWHTGRAQWYFYAPSLEASGGLANYTASRGYLDFGTITLTPATGFWVNKP